VSRGVEPLFGHRTKKNARPGRQSLKGDRKVGNEDSLYILSHYLNKALKKRTFCFRLG
jgi:hypothetical protein